MDHSTASEIQAALYTAYDQTLKGEDFHPTYKKNEDIYRDLADADMQTERAVNDYLDEYWDEMTARLNWSEFEMRKASRYSFLAKAFIDSQKEKLAGVFDETLTPALVAGGTFVSQTTGVGTDWGNSNELAIDFMRTYTVKLSGMVSDTTLKRVNKSIRKSIEFGETRSQATSRLEDVILDRDRAEMIAHTESVRAFAAGQMAAGDQIGANTKEWDATVNPCPICTELDKKEVRLHESFSSSVLGKKIAAPPAHPFCRCIININMPSENERTNKKPTDPEELLQNWF